MADKLHTTVHASSCPHCGTAHEAHSTDEDIQPQPGNISICGECVQVSVFGDDMQLRLPNNEEKFFIDTDPTIKAEVARFATAVSMAKITVASKKG